MKPRDYNPHLETNRDSSIERICRQPLRKTVWQKLNHTITSVLYMDIMLNTSHKNDHIFFIPVENNLSSINYYTTWKERKKWQKKTNQSGLDHFKLLNELQMTPSRANPIWFQDIAKAYLITSLFFLIFGKLKQRSSNVIECL